MGPHLVGYRSMSPRSTRDAADARERDIPVDRAAVPKERRP